MGTEQKQCRETKGGGESFTARQLMRTRLKFWSCVYLCVYVSASKESVPFIMGVDDEKRISSRRYRFDRQVYVLLTEFHSGASVGQRSAPNIVPFEVSDATSV